MLKSSPPGVIPTRFSDLPGGNRFQYVFLRAIFHLGGQKTWLDFNTGGVDSNTLVLITPYAALSP